MSMPPTGTVTFLFTDIEGSTKLAQAHPAEWESARLRHYAILRETVEAHQGYVFQVIGDAFCVAFPTASDGLLASLAAQRALHAEAWGETPIRVRMGIHTGTAEARDKDYRGYLTLAHIQRVMSAAYGGQILVSNATAGLLFESLPGDVTLRDMGEHRLKGLLNPEHLWQVAASDLPQDFPPLHSVSANPNNLSIQPTSFVGREGEIAEVKRLLAAANLLTLTGVGGTGKTRLSLQVAADLLTTFNDGVWFVALAPLTDPSLVPNRVATVLGVRQEQERALLATLSDNLRAKHLLLVLDNCEHLIEACAQFADAILRTCVDVRILASSREALGIAGEQIFHVPSLQVPNPQTEMSVGRQTQYESVRLFVERAKSVKADFELTNANAPAVVQICQRVDGIPLAIELAAARVKALSVEQISARLDDRFSLLTSGNRIALPRHQTLRALIDWSYNLLTEPERLLFRRLAVFAGGWSLQAAEQVCTDAIEANRKLDSTDVLDVLTHLIDKSLVIMETASGEPRYRLLETIRQYAREKLLESGERERVYDRHLAYLVKLAEEAEPNLRHAELARWRRRIETELDNVRSALAWSMDTAQIEKGLQLAAALNIFWFGSGHLVEGIETLEKLLARPEAASQTLVRARVLLALCTLVALLGDSERTTRAAREALAIGQALHHTRTTALALFYLGRAKYLERNFAQAQAFLEQSVALSRTLDDKPRIALALGWLGFVLDSMGDYARADSCLGDSLVLLLAEGDKDFAAWNLRGWGFALLHRHDLSGALKKFRESLRLHAEAGHRIGVPACLAACAAVALWQGQLERAAQLFGASEIQLEAIRSQLPIDELGEYTHNVDALRTQLDKVTFDAGWAAGRALTLEQAIALALRDDL